MSVGPSSNSSMVKAEQASTAPAPKNVEQLKAEVAKAMMVALADYETKEAQKFPRLVKNNLNGVVDILHRKVIPHIGETDGKSFVVLKLRPGTYFSQQRQLDRRRGYGAFHYPELDNLAGIADMVCHAMMRSDKFFLKIERASCFCPNVYLLKARYIQDTYRG